MFLSFGLRTSPRIYNLFGEAIQWTMNSEYNWTISHYVDDYLSVFPSDTSLTEASTTFNTVCQDFGFETEPAKDEMGTYHCQTFRLHNRYAFHDRYTS